MIAVPAVTVSEDDEMLNAGAASPGANARIGRTPTKFAFLRAA